MDEKDIVKHLLTRRPTTAPDRKTIMEKLAVLFTNIFLLGPHLGQIMQHDLPAMSLCMTKYPNVPHTTRLNVLHMDTNVCPPQHPEFSVYGLI